MRIGRSHALERSILTNKGIEVTRCNLLDDRCEPSVPTVDALLIVALVDETGIITPAADEAIVLDIEVAV